MDSPARCVALALVATLGWACSSVESTNHLKEDSLTNESSPPTNASTPTSGKLTSKTATTPPTPSAGCSKKDPIGGLRDRHLDVHGTERTYDLEIPSPYDATRSYPLVFAFHGGGGSSASARATFDFSSVARDSAIFVYPAAMDGNWDLDSPTDQNADIVFFDALVDSLSASHCVDTQRVFATGFSNGAYFANQLGCRRGDVLRAIAPHGGGGPFGGDSDYDDNGHLKCTAKVPAALVVHGSDDDVVALHEGERTRDHWRQANGCSSRGIATTPSPCVAYQGCSADVAWCGVSGLGHDFWAEGIATTWQFFASF